MFLSPVAVAQSGTGIIQGHVLDESTREPLIGANISVVGTSIGSTTDVEGHFQIYNLAPGIYRLQVSSIGHKPFIKADVVVASGKQVEVVIALEVAAVELGEVTIQPSAFGMHANALQRSCYATTKIWRSERDSKWLSRIP